MLQSISLMAITSVFSLQHFIYRIILHLPRMGEDDDLPDQSDRYRLHSKHHQKNAEEQQRPVCNAPKPQDPVESQIKGYNPSSRKKSRTNETEEAERLLGKFKEEQQD